jgi:hypothetical protein
MTLPPTLAGAYAERLRPTTLFSCFLSLENKYLPIERREAHAWILRSKTLLQRKSMLIANTLTHFKM